MSLAEISVSHAINVSTVTEPGSVAVPGISLPNPNFPVFAEKLPLGTKWNKVRFAIEYFNWIILILERSWRYYYRHWHAFATHIPVAMLSILFSFHLFKVIALSWSLKTSTTTSCTIENNLEGLPGDAPLPPNLMKINWIFWREENGGNFRHWLITCNL